MRRACVLVATALLLLLMVGSPNAGAITNGNRDGADHPNVGALLYKADVGGGVEELFQGCSGALMAPDLVLTAGHCVVGWDPDHVFVSFDTNLNMQPDYSVNPANVIAVTDLALAPGFHFGGRATAYNDVAVLTLAHEVVGIDPVDLPSQNFLGEQRRAGTLQGHAIVNVGYGGQTVVHSWASYPKGEYLEDGYRWVSTSPAIALTPYHLHVLAENAATGGGGLCFGDSGGPHFYGDGSNLTVAVSTSADPMCEALNQLQRLDTPTVYPFLQSFLS